jgi:hypothetical protein
MKLGLARLPLLHLETIQVIEVNNHAWKIIGKYECLKKFNFNDHFLSDYQLPFSISKTESRKNYV